MSMSVTLYVSVCFSASISPEQHVRSSPNSYACYVWLCLGPCMAALRYVVYTSGVMDDVTFASLHILARNRRREKGVYSAGAAGFHTAANN